MRFALCKNHNVAEEVFKLKAFPFSLIDSAWVWLLNLSLGSFSTCETIVKIILLNLSLGTYAKEFLKKIIPTIEDNHDQKGIKRIKRKREESLFK